MEDERLIIDLAAAAEVPADSAVRGWAQTQRVFISSVMGDFSSVRSQVADAIASIGAAPIWFEDFGGRDDDAERAYLAEVDTSDIYLGILGTRYGRLLNSRLSATHEEFRRAESRGHRVSVWVEGESEMQSDQVAFLEEVRKFHTTGTFADVDDLADKVLKRLRKICAEELSPWCKLGDAIFRATKVTDSATHVSVLAIVKDDHVTAYLKRLREGRGRIRFTYSQDSFEGVVEDLTLETTATRSRTIQLVINRQGHQSSSIGDFSFGVGTSTYTPEDLTEMALRQTLFGEDPRLGLGGTGLLPKFANPFASLSDVPEEVIRPLLRLLFTESFVGQGRAEAVTTMRMGVDMNGERELLLAWIPPPRHANVPVVERCIHGRVRVAVSQRS